MNLKKVLLVFVFVVVGFLAACGDSEAEVSAKPSEIEEWLKIEIPSAINEDIQLPTTHPEVGGNITWLSADETVLTSAGVVTLESGARDVLLAYDIEHNGALIYGELTIFVSAITAEDISIKFLRQFGSGIGRDYNVIDEFDGWKVVWESSNEELFSNDGIYNKPHNDTKITMSYEIVDEIFGSESELFTSEIIVRGLFLSEKIEIYKNWLSQNALDSNLITEDLDLPTHYEQYDSEITWISSNPNVIDSEGRVTRYPFDRYIKLTATATIDNVGVKVDTSVIVKADDREYTIEEKIDAFLDAIAISELDRLTFGGYGGITQSYNFIPFYENVNAPLVEQIMPLNSERPAGTKEGRPGTKLYSHEFITIHDTANTNKTADAEMHARLLTNGFGQVSWHLAIDENGAYKSVPFDEVAYHAGDGSARFGLNDTGVKANGPYPKLTISIDGYYELNGEKSLVKAPTTIDGSISETRHIADSGIYTTIGENGNYFINNTYFNKEYSKISNNGGNRNSIGIETAVNQGSDYSWTVRHTAKLVAELLIEYDLGVDRVLQHNNFSGKPCPNSIRHTGYWDNFLDLIALEKFAKEELADVQFVWESLTAVLNDEGMINFEIGEAIEVEYKVTVSFAEEEIMKTYKTRLN